MPTNATSGHGGQGDFFGRVVRYLNGALLPDECDAFNAELEADPAKRDLFVRACLTQAAVSEELSTQYHIFREGLAERLPPITEPPLPAVQVRPPAPGTMVRRWRRWAAAAAIGVIAASAALVAVFQDHAPLPPRVSPIATVTASHNARWLAGPDADGGIIPQSELSLASGWAEITYHTGTKVTVAGASTFALDSPNLLNLHSGRLSATVAGNDFTVFTPDARIADLGTAFGVSVSDATELAVFSGKVEASSRRDAQGANRRVLEAGAGAHVTGDRVVDGLQPAWPQLFPRELPPGITSLSVADLLSGGEGTMGRRAAALDFGTGAWTYGRGDLVPASATGDHGYHRVSQLRVLDGCFIPDGPSVIDSEGHVFEFSKTSNISYNQLWVGGRIPWPRQDSHRMGTVLQGVDYAEPPHALVAFPSNKGITIDLEELRAMHPGGVFEAFRATLGNTFPTRAGGEPVIARTDVFILVDGQSRLAKRQFTNHDAPVKVDVPLQPQDRFLTLAVTDGGDGVGGDWILWGDPEITLTATGAVP
jgi:ferric-dicitrate binding protein FerR (iron transport regulator)